MAVGDARRLAYNPGVTSWYESAIDRQIREAQERGDFDDLPGMGKPIPGQGEHDDENWWLKHFVRRENLSDVLPETLKVRRDRENLARTLAGKQTEAAVREAVAELNARIDRARRGLLDGPAVTLPTVDEDEAVEAWRAARTQPPTPER